MIKQTGYTWLWECVENFDASPTIIPCPDNDRAISGTVIGWEMRWDMNFDSTLGKFKVPFYFDRSEFPFATKEKETIRDILRQYERFTCVKLVEVSKNDEGTDYTQ